MTNPFKPGPLVAEIITSLRDEPEKWGLCQDGHLQYADRKMCEEAERKILIWGALRMRGRGIVPTNFIERYRLRRAVRAWKRRA